MSIPHKKTALLAGMLCLASLLGSSAWADIIHFHNGKVLHTKVRRVTGEIIELKGSLTGRTDIRRIELTSRRDVVETDGGTKYFGEIIYIDKFKVEINTPTGRRKIPRMFVRNVVLGTPKIETPSDYIESTRQQYSGNKPLTTTMPVNYAPSKRMTPEEPATLIDDSFEE